MDDDQLRERFIAIAASFVGCGYASDAQRFMDLVAPGEAPARQREMASLDSTCGLACRGWLGPANLGLEDPRLVAPYHDTRVNSDLAAMAREAGALVTIAEAEPGDIVIIGAPEHVFIIEEIRGVALSTLQGGERDPVHHAQCIARMSRTLRSVGMRTLVDDRPIEFVISLPALAARFLP